MTKKSDKHLAWSLRIFFSVDLIGSSSYKASKNDDNWCFVFEEFFNKFPVEFKKKYTKYKKDSDYFYHFKDAEVFPQVWKLLGDEIIFYADLKDYPEVATHVIAFYHTLKDYNSYLKNKREQKETLLQCKGTVWLAGFPVTNVEIKINKNSPIDFIGSAIDAGFRLSKESSLRRLVLSIEAVWLFATAMSGDNKPSNDKIYKIRYGGQKELKGVCNNSPYPIFWLDMDANTYEESIDKWTNLSQCTYQQVQDFAKNFIEKSDYLIRPFIEDGGSPFDKISDEMEKRKEKRVEEKKKKESDFLLDLNSDDNIDNKDVLKKTKLGKSKK